MSVVVWKKYTRKKESSYVKHEQWEKDYILKSFGRYDIMKQYIEISKYFSISLIPNTKYMIILIHYNFLYFWAKSLSFNLGFSEAQYQQFCLFIYPLK